MEVDLGRAHVLVTEPESDDRGIDAAGEQLHGVGVTEDVGSDRLCVQGRLLTAGGLGVVADQALWTCPETTDNNTMRRGRPPLPDNLRTRPARRTRASSADAAGCR